MRLNCEADGSQSSLALPLDGSWCAGLGRHFNWTHYGISYVLTERTCGAVICGRTCSAD